MQLDREAAIRGTAWGRYQVLGGHLLELFPNDPVGMFDAQPEIVSDALLVSWFRGRPKAQAAANRCDITELSYLYNGSRTSPWAGRVRAVLDELGGCGKPWWFWPLGLAVLGGAGYAGVMLAQRIDR